MGLFLRRLFRYAFPAAAGGAALALVACLILWPLSYRRGMALRYATSGRSSYELGVGRGRLWVHYWVDSGRRPGFSCCFVPPWDSFAGWSYTDWDHEAYEAVYPDAAEELYPPSGSRVRALGGVWYRGAGLTYLGLPFLYPTLLSAILPAFWLRGFIWRRRQAHRSGFPIEPAAPAR